MGSQPWRRWTDAPTPLVRDYWFRRAWIAEQAEIAAHNMQGQPAGQYAHLVLDGKFLGSKKAAVN